MVINIGPSAVRLDRGGSEEGSFRRYVADVRTEVNEHIDALLSPYCGGVEGRDIRYLTSGGKRLRAGLAMLTFDALAGNDRERKVALDLAAAIEIAHSASLILDDMLDGDGARRGRVAAHVSKGRKRALLEMTGLLSIPYSIVNVHGSRYTAWLAQTHRDVVEGELLQVDAVESGCTLERYVDIISLKTGQMFSLAARFGTMAAGRIDRLVEQMAGFGLAVGTIMQIADDITDLEKRMEGGPISEPGSEMLLRSSLGRSPVGPGSHQWNLHDVGARSMELLNEHIRQAEDLLPSERSGGAENGLDHFMTCLRSAPGDIVGMMMAPVGSVKE